jgi:hypothetical protein
MGVLYLGAGSGVFVLGGIVMRGQQTEQRERQDNAGKRYRPLLGRFGQFGFRSHSSLSNRMRANRLICRLWLGMSELRQS